jgi:hypothetical protein
MRVGREVFSHSRGDFSHGLTRISADKSDRLAANRTGGNASCWMTSARSGLSSERETSTLRREPALGIRLQANYWQYPQTEKVRALAA